MLYRLKSAMLITSVGRETLIVRKKGGALFKYGSRIGVADVIFGEEEDSLLLGAFSLEALGLALDPMRRELRELPMTLGGLDTGVLMQRGRQL